ncbi:MAG: LysR family transcriptional regulator [Acidobacteriota bacterium]
MNLEIRHLRLIMAIAEEGSVTRAGDRLHLTQSALSHQLRDAEEKLGTPLFLRLNKRLILTPAGEKLLGWSYKILDSLQRASEDIKQISSNKQGVLRISTGCYTCYHWLPTVLKPFHKKYPRVDVQIVVEATDEPIEALLDGKIDMAIISWQVRDRRINLHPIFKDELVAAMHPDHPLATRPYLNASDFADQHLLVYSLPVEEITLFQKFLIPAGIMPKQVSQVKLTEAMIEIVKAGLGICAMARWAIAPQTAAGELCALPITKRGFYRQWSAATIKSKTAPPFLAEFAKLLSDHNFASGKTPRRSHTQ